jgi:GNAT superfamily N-acetyltransferase
MTPPVPTIRLAVPEDAAPLAALGRRTFFDTFANDTAADDMRLHLAASYGVDLQRAEIEDRHLRTLVVEADGALAAYAQVRHGHPPPACVTGPKPVELARFYVDRPWIGRGIAQRLMAAVREEAEALGGETLWLGVWERNFRAMAFYGKCGFVDVGSHPYVVGNDPQTDRLMECRLRELRV